jgi:hypothetical protein
LLDRIKPEIVAPGQSDTALGNWYATVLFWKPQVALLVSERTLLPVLMPLAPSGDACSKISRHSWRPSLKEHGVLARIHRTGSLADGPGPVRQDGEPERRGHPQ